MDAIILAGGKGSRLDQTIPKPLVHAQGKPILAHQLDNFLTHPTIDKIILCLGHKADEIITYVRTNYPNTNIGFSVEDYPLGTGGALKKALAQTNTDTILVGNVDDLTNINLTELTEKNESTICVAKRRSPYGTVIEKDGYATFEEKPLLPDWTSCGWYLFKKDDLAHILPDTGSLERHTSRCLVFILKHCGVLRRVGFFVVFDVFFGVE